jgi:putative transposase
VLVLIGATEDGTKELLAVVDGYSESTQSWRELLGALKRLGLSTAPKLAIGDGSLGFWIALQEEYGQVARNAVGFIRRSTSWLKCPRAFGARPSN